MAYAVCAVGVNHAAGRAAGGSIHAQIEAFLELGLGRLGEGLARRVPGLQ
jgi:hypothetical protein